MRARILLGAGGITVKSSPGARNSPPNSPSQPEVHLDQLSGLLFLLQLFLSILILQILLLAALHRAKNKSIVFATTEEVLSTEIRIIPGAHKLLSPSHNGTGFLLGDIRRTYIAAT